MPRVWENILEIQSVTKEIGIAEQSRSVDAKKRCGADAKNLRGAPLTPAVRAEMKTTTYITHALLQLPLFAAAVYLALGRSPVHSYLSAATLILLILVPILLLVSASVAKQHARGLRRLAPLSPCALAPLAVLSAWTTAPGPGYGGWGFFLHWLTKYPNFGLINIEVFLGIVCVLLSSLIPAVFAGYAITQHPRRLSVLALLALELACLVAVAINLDVGFLFCGVGLLMGPTLFAGPVFRLAGAVAMSVAAVRICLRKTEQSHGEALEQRGER